MHVLWAAFVAAAPDPPWTTSAVAVVGATSRSVPAAASLSTTDPEVILGARLRAVLTEPARPAGARAGRRIAISPVLARALPRTVLAIQSEGTRFLAERSEPPWKTPALAVDMIAPLESVFTFGALLVAMEPEEIHRTLHGALVASVAAAAVALPVVLVAVRVVTTLAFVLARRAPQSLLALGFASGSPPTGLALTGARHVVATQRVVQFALAGERAVLTVTACGAVLDAVRAAVARGADALPALGVTVASVVAQTGPVTVGSELAERADGLTGHAVVSRRTLALARHFVAIGTLFTGTFLETSLTVRSWSAR